MLHNIAWLDQLVPAPDIAIMHDSSWHHSAWRETGTRIVGYQFVSGQIKWIHLVEGMPIH